jgi:hypothetical protein
MSRHFPNWLAAYLEYSSHNEAPEKFHFWTGVSCLAGAVRRQVWIDQAYFQWTPNFYIVFVGPPGIITKSTTISIGGALLRRVPSVTFGPQSITWQALLTALVESETYIEGEPGTYTPMSAVTFSVSELGTFLDPANRDQLDLLTGLWDGQKGVFDKVTKTQGGDVVENPWVNIIACTTPSWLRDNVTESIMGGGLSSRIIWIWGDKKRRLVAYPADHVPPGFSKTGDWLVEDLMHIAGLCGPIRLSNAAKSWGKAWYKTHYERAVMGSYTADESMSGYISRKQTHLHKIAMILSLSEGDSLLIEESHLTYADKVLAAVETEMRRVFDSIRITPQARLASLVLDRVPSGGIELQKLFREFFHTTEYKEFEAAVRSCLQAGHLTTERTLSGALTLQRTEE